MNQGDPLGSPDKEPILTTIQKTESTGSILEQQNQKYVLEKRNRQYFLKKRNRQYFLEKTKSKVCSRQTLQEIPDIKCLFTSEMRASRARQQSRVTRQMIDFLTKFVLYLLLIQKRMSFSNCSSHLCQTKWRTACWTWQSDLEHFTRFACARQ